MLKSRHQIGLETNGLDLGPGLEGFVSVPISVSPDLEVRNLVATSTRAPIYKISYDLSQDYRKFVAVYEYHLRRSCDFPSESYLREALRSSRDVR